MPEHTSTTDPPPTLRIGRCIDAIERTAGFVATLRDSFELAANNYDHHLANRLYVCDYIERRLRKVAGDLEQVRKGIQHTGPQAATL